MEKIEEPLKGAFIIKPNIFGDHRGYFFESFNENKFSELVGNKVEFVQDNESLSGPNILRGLHFQAPPFEQGKLVRVVTGSVLDVFVDIRKDSETYGQHHVVKLSAENKLMAWIPPGFAHGFVSLEEETRFLYKCTNVYNKESEGSVLWKDPQLNINWYCKTPILSDKDKISPLFKDFKSPF